MNRIFRFRSLQQKLGFYAFVLSFGAMIAVSVLTYRVARDQVQEDRQQLMEVYARQIAQDLDRELNNAEKDLRLWGETDFVQASLKNPRDSLFATFFDDLIRHQSKYDLIFTIGTDGRVAGINSIGHEEAGKPVEM